MHIQNGSESCKGFDINKIDRAKVIFKVRIKLKVIVRIFSHLPNNVPNLGVIGLKADCMCNSRFGS